MFRYRLLLFVFCILFLSFSNLIQAEELTVKEAVGIALKNNPQLKASKWASSAVFSQIGQKKSAFYPQVSWQSAYNRNYKEEEKLSSPYYNSYRTDFEVNQLLFDFEKTKNLVKASKEGYESSKWDYQKVRQMVILNTEIAYFNCLASRRMVKLNEKIVEQKRQLLYKAQQFFKVGLKPKIDTTKAEANLYDTKLSLIKAKNTEDLFKVDLINAMGIKTFSWTNLKDILEIETFNNINLLEAKHIALKNRPEILQNKAQRREEEYLLKAVKAEYFPTLNGSITYGWQNTKFPLKKEWTAGANISFPLFSGFLTKKKVEEERAKIMEIKENGETVVQDILKEVEKAYLDMRAHRQAIITAKKGCRASQENLNLANERYKQGLNTIIEITDAQVQYSNAETNYIKALYDYKMAETRFKKATGEYIED